MTTTPAQNDNPALNGSDLCLACGLCCTGVLFDYAPLKPDELELANQLILPLSTKNKKGEESFRLPCPCFLDGKCSVYGQTRPAICGEYQCDLLKAYLNGEVSLDTGLERIKAATGLVAAVKPYMAAENGRPQYLWDQIADFVTEQQQGLTAVEFRRKHAKFLLNVTMLWTICSRFFDEKMVEPDVLKEKQA